MKVVQLAAVRRGGLRPNHVWVERAFPDRHWIIVDVTTCEDGQRRVLIEPLEDRTREASYSETYFRRHFIDRVEWLRRRNEQVLRQARRREPIELLHEMVHINTFDALEDRAA